MPNPSPRDRYGHAYDFKRDQWWLFGGTVSDQGGGDPNAGPNLADVWRLDTVSWTWTELILAGGPTARRQAAGFYDPTLDRIFFFGGSDGAHQNDLWEIDPSAPAWFERVMTDTPVARQFPSLALFDSERILRMYGGQDFAPMFTDQTFELDMKTWAWKRIFTKAAPPARQLAGGFIDPTTGHMMIFGGQLNDLSLTNEMWEYIPKARRWIEVIVDPRLAKPSDRGGGLTVDPLAKIGYHHGGDGLWAFDFVKRRWRRIEEDREWRRPSPRIGDGLTFLSRRGRLVAFGGIAGVVSLGDLFERRI